jgi:hypothetical protein
MIAAPSIAIDLPLKISSAKTPAEKSGFPTIVPTTWDGATNCHLS